VDEMCKVIKIPRNEIQIIIQELISKGLAEVNTGNANTSIKLTQAGNEKSRLLLNLLQQHDKKINQLLGDDVFLQFRGNLKKIIDWNY
ncbi:MAG: hypothetical protein HKN08_03190, partial [Gammaproteobacteria bacterium]|nr:hypothetical protein [Gammaproteobacteria bacterium]